MSLFRTPILLAIVCWVMMHAYAQSRSSAVCGYVCSNTSSYSGAWQLSTHSGHSWLAANISESEVNVVQVQFQLAVTQPGNYSLRMYTPGCTQDGSCNTRGTMNITGCMSESAGTTCQSQISTNVSQTNTEDKYDNIWFGTINDSYAQILMWPIGGQPVQYVVAEMVELGLRAAIDPAPSSSASSTTGSPSSGTANPGAGNGNRKSSSSALRIGLGVGISMAGLLLLAGLATIFFLKARHRRQGSQLTKAGPGEIVPTSIINEMEATEAPRKELATVDAELYELGGSSMPTEVGGSIDVAELSSNRGVGM